MTTPAFSLHDTLEQIKHRELRVEFWSAQELMAQLGYHKWADFLNVIEKAKVACIQSGQQADNHFLLVEEQRQTLHSNHHHSTDILLTRYACYLVTQNANPENQAVAAAQTYFALQTRRRELSVQQSRERRRLETRQSLRETEGRIEGTVYRRGIRSSSDFSSFKNRHIKALYGGLTVKEMKERRGIPVHRSLADFDSHLELRAKDFSLAMTDHNIKQKNLVGKKQLEQEVVENSIATRRTLIQRGIHPEELPPEEDLQAVEKRHQQQESFLNQNLNPQLLKLREKKRV